MLRCEWRGFEIAGYSSGQYSFEKIISSSRAMSEDMASLAGFLVAAKTGSSGPSTCCIIISGHSDRYDVANTPALERIKQEMSAAQLRAADAYQWFIKQLANEGLLYDSSQPSVVDDTIMLKMGGYGAGALEYVNPGNDETKRKANRRVQIDMYRSFTED